MSTRRGLYAILSWDDEGGCNVDSLEAGGETGYLQRIISLVSQGEGTQVSPGHFSLSHCIKACLSRLFSCCWSVQSVDMCEKPGPREKPEAPKSKFFNLKTFPVKLKGDSEKGNGEGSTL